MTVEQLMAALKKFDPASPVLITDAQAVIRWVETIPNPQTPTAPVAALIR